MKPGSAVGEMIRSDQLTRGSVVKPHGSVGPETDLKIVAVGPEMQNGVDRQRAESLFFFPRRKTEHDRLTPVR